MDISPNIWILTWLFITLGVCGSNSPPSLTSSKDWHVREDDPVDTIVTNLKASDPDGDHVTFILESQVPTNDIHTYFYVDDHNRVRTAKPLTGLVPANRAHAYHMVRVRVEDGHTTVPIIVEVRVQVTRSNKNGGKPGNNGRIGKPNGGNGRFTGNINRWEDIGAGLPLRGTPPFIQVPLPSTSHFIPEISNFNFNEAASAPTPPVIRLGKRLWEVEADVKIGTMIEKLEVIDTSGKGYKIILEGANGLLNVGQSGNVSVAVPLANHVGDTPINVIATNGQTQASEPVIFRVKPAASSSHPAPSTATPSEPLNHPVTISTVASGTTSRIPIKVITSTISLPTSTVTPKTSKTRNNNSQDLRVVDQNGGSGFSGENDSETKEAPQSDIRFTIIPIIIVVGVSPLALALYCYWKRIKDRKATAEAKEGAVTYNEKRGESVSAQLSPQVSRENENTPIRANSIMSRILMFRQKAQSNKYEDGLTNGGSNNKRKLSEISSPMRDNWEFPRHHLKFMGILGEGCFGQVWKSEALGLQGKPSIIVAVKTVKESAGERERKDLVQELKVLKGLGGHTNVVSILGCCTEKEPILIILEYMSGGKLQSFLRASRADASYNNLHGSSSSITPRDLTIFAHQIARGMDFLARNGIIHRDLAARNILVGEDKICKVADFGFARDIANNRIYERKSDGRLPIRWMAPESLFDNIFTSKSDVWSFGVLLWEIVTLGSTPYPGMGASEVMKKVKDGYRLEKPDHCRREVYNIMYYCWDKSANERPSFTELVHTLERLILSEVDYIELDQFPNHSYYNIITEKRDELV